MSNDRTGARTMSSLEPCPTPWCNTEEQPYIWQGPDDKYCVICPGCQVEGPYQHEEAEAIDDWITRAPIPVTDEMVERATVTRCIELIREVGQGFLSPEYATNQPLSSFQERFACRMAAERLEQEYALGTTEQRALLGKPAITAALGGN